MTAMKACAQNKVKRIVMTCSMASIFNVNPKNRPSDGVFDETYFADPEIGDNYLRSKTAAEDTAW